MEISSRNPVAKKEHVCDFCNGIIPKGEKYKHATNKYEGMLYTWKSHLSCLRLIEALDMEGDGDGITSDEFCEYVSDAFSDLKIEGGRTFEERITIVKSKYLNGNQA